MARPLRIQYPGAVYHITSRGNAKNDIFINRKDRISFLDMVQRINYRYNWICHSYCLMNNHYHLLIETPDGNLSKGMRQLNGVYTQTFNRGHKRVGHLFQGRYKAILIEKESHLLEVCRYVVLNPVRAGIAENPAAWQWSSFKATAGQGKVHPCLTVDWVLHQFSEMRQVARKRYTEFVKAGIGEESIWKAVRGQSILGKNDFADSLLSTIKGHEEIKEIPRSQRFLTRPGLEMIFVGIPMRNNPQLIKAAQKAVLYYGYSQKEVADHIGVHYCTVSRMVNARSKT